MGTKSYAGKSPWVIHYDGSSCNGCDIEVLAALTPLYDAERFGVVNTGNPKHADILVVTGGINEQNAPVVRQIYEQMLEPKVVVACGACACGGGVYVECYNVRGGTETAGIPVDAYVPGCAVRPESVIDAVVAGVKLLDEKAAKMGQAAGDKHREVPADAAANAGADKGASAQVEESAQAEEGTQTADADGDKKEARA